MILPSLTFALTLYGAYTLIVRSALLETMGEDYVLTARAKGLSTRTILRRHVLPNALLPITSLIALSVGYVVAGAILVETVFSWPGVGRAIYDAVGERDYPMLQGAFLVLTIVVVTANFIAELLYARLDPRIGR
jgi:peptide/nickel transport system permease protein